MASSNEPKTVVVQTTMRPDKDLKVTERERDSLTRLGYLKTDNTAPAEKEEN